jgi:hypothetical protein
VNLTKPDETTEDAVRNDCLGVADWGGPTSSYIRDAIPEEARRIVEHAWSAKTLIRWTRDDRGPLNALRWRIWDHFNTGHPPSRPEGKKGALWMVNEDGSLAEPRSQKDYVRRVSIVSKWAT